MKTFEQLAREFDDAAQDGLVAAFSELLKDEKFRQLAGCLATAYAVTERKVESLDQRSFQAAKQRLQTFLARTTGWNAKLSRDTRNGRWRGGAVHPSGEVQGRPDQGDLVSLGRRGGRVRGELEAASSKAADSPSEVPAKALQRHSLKRNCPTCQSVAGKVWRIPQRGLVCPHCVRKVSSGNP